MAAAITIPVSCGYEALVSPEDVALVSGYRWYPHGPHGAMGTFYATTAECGKTLYMHRVILGLQAGERADHINYNGLDNRRDNLRICTHSQNIARARRRQPKSGYRGVSANGIGYAAEVWINGEKIHLGTFPCARTAARVYDEAVVEIHGEFALTNRELGWL